MAKLLQVAVAIMTKPNGEYLLASRPDGKGWAGWWEFPGGKIEQGEMPEAALSRELQEELGVKPTLVQAWIKRRYDYPAIHDAEAKTVLLHFYFVYGWQGQPEPLEGQVLAWQHPAKLDVSPILPANAPVMHALSVPDVYAISNAEKMGEAHFLNALAHKLQQGIKLIQVCEKHLSREDLIGFAEKVQLLAKQYGARVLINSDINLAIELGLAGVHLSGQALLALKEKPSGLLVAASCNHADELAYAQKLGLDLVTFSPVAETQKQSSKASFSWSTFAAVVENVSIPVYALGNMHVDNISQALSNGARGVAMQQSIWHVTET